MKIALSNKWINLVMNQKDRIVMAFPGQNFFLQVKGIKHILGYRSVRRLYVIKL